MSLFTLHLTCPTQSASSTDSLASWLILPSFNTQSVRISPVVSLIKGTLLEEYRLEGLSTLAIHIRRSLENLVEDEGLRDAFWLQISDPSLMSRNYPRLLEISNRNDGDIELNVTNLSPDEKPEIAILCAAFYKAVFFFLLEGDRFISREATFAALFSAWQWYNLVKRMAAGEPLVEINFHNGRDLSNELSAAHRSIVQVLEDPRFALAIRWLAQWNGIDSSQYKSGPLLKEKMRLSLPLWQQPGNELAVELPLPAPGYLQETDMNWKNISLHPVFVNDSGAQAAVRRLIVEWLLPRYDFIRAIRLSLALRNGDKKHRLPGWFARLQLLFLAGGWASIIIAAIFYVAFFLYPDASIKIPGNFKPGLFIELATVFLPLLAALLWMDWKSLGNFMLPRVIGGVFIGYLSIVLQGDSSIKISMALAQPQEGSPASILLFMLLWLSVLSTGFVYLFYDAYPLVRDVKTAAFRAAHVLVYTFIISALAGLLSVALTTTSYVASRPLGLFLGPFGWVDTAQYLTFVPIALFTGLVTQFIFEELTLPTSVWAREQE